jgi:hypothetical protein
VLQQWMAAAMVDASPRSIVRCYTVKHTSETRLLEAGRLVIVVNQHEQSPLNPYSTSDRLNAA